MTTTEACARGCALYRQHLADCDTDDCRGCLPRRAQHGHLCWPCHRRLEMMLTDADTLDRWLTGNLASGQGAAPEDVKVKTSSDDPAPIKVHVFDKRQDLRDHWATWVDWLCERESLDGPGRHTVKADARFLLAWLGRVEYWAEIDDLWEQTAMLCSEAHALAPWRPAVRRVGSIPCPECGEVNLVIYGGETDVTCQSCHTLIREEHFGLWERIVTDEAREFAG